MKKIRRVCPVEDNCSCEGIDCSNVIALLVEIPKSEKRKFIFNKIFELWQKNKAYYILRLLHLVCLS